MTEYIPIPVFAKRAGVSKQAVYARLDKDLSAYCQEIDGRKMLDVSALSLYGPRPTSHWVNQEVIKGQAENGQESIDFPINKQEPANDQPKDNQRSAKSQSNFGQEPIENQTSADRESSGETENGQETVNKKGPDNQESIEHKTTDNQESNKLTAYLTAEIDRLRKEVETRDATIVYKDVQIAGFADKFAAMAEREQSISAMALQTTGQAQLLHATTQEDSVPPEGEADPPRGNWFTRIFK